MIAEPADCAGMTLKTMRQDFEFVADQRWVMLRLPPCQGVRNPFTFMPPQDVQERIIFFAGRVSAYQVAGRREVGFDHAS